MPVRIFKTSDGSHSLLNTELNETYHSVHGAVQESNHVFIKNGFDFFCERSFTEPVRILEIGFGTGLNVCLTAYRSLALGRKVHYTSLETFPLPEAIWSQLNYANSPEEKHFFKKIHEAAWSEDVPVLPHFSLMKVETALERASLEYAVYDLVYFDAFAPGKQPELWHRSVLEKVVSAMKPNAVFVTYCAKGQVKRDLKTLNMVIETLAGPPGKKEMTRALKI